MNYENQSHPQAAVRSFLIDVQRSKDPPWIREIRESLGMTAEDLAKRMGVIRKRVNRIELDEISGKLTMDSLTKAAETLDCELFYVFIPKVSLEASVKAQALQSARLIVDKVDVARSPKSIKEFEARSRFSTRE
jgi:predicted DNA-binding mobile mystery protein A